jgi:hypothetical protein
MPRSSQNAHRATLGFAQRFALYQGTTLVVPQRRKTTLGRNRRSLHYATPDFLWNLVALVHFMRPSLRKGAHVVLSSARGRKSGFASVGMTKGRAAHPSDSGCWDRGNSRSPFDNNSA